MAISFKVSDVPLTRCAAAPFKVDGTTFIQGSTGVNGSKKTYSLGQNSFANAAMAAYANHHNLVIRPDDVWIAIMTQFSFYVNANSEEAVVSTQSTGILDHLEQTKHQQQYIHNLSIYLLSFFSPTTPYHFIQLFSLRTREYYQSNNIITMGSSSSKDKPRSPEEIQKSQNEREERARAAEDRAKKEQGRGKPKGTSY
eukprot:TRINITY_DN1473_c0_g1_i4.p1 TRINITY_DN1473_c0_g1~~TRINITY_DN1473_c0_g1_i4.p1  ORF type:complete len:198 (+),score=45.84 TRINITY_DN1473_c0_g1_i4:235-828(+)